MQGLKKIYQINKKLSDYYFQGNKKWFYKNNKNTVVVQEK